MTGLVRKATFLLAACGVLVAGAASANVPDPAQSTIPSRIFLVGNNGGAVDVSATAGGTFGVTVKDLSGALINNSLVAIDFSGCNDVRICSSQSDGSLVVECPSKVIRKFTTAGLVSMTITGIGFNANRTPAGTGCAKVYADGVFLGNVQVGCYDHLGGGVGASDLAAWIDDFLALTNPARSDYLAPFANVGAVDLSKWVDVSTSTLSSSNCSPGPPTSCN